jgi:hypothetical protein
LEKGYALPLNKVESPSHKDDICRVWLNLAQRFWRRFLKWPHPIFIFLWLSPLWRECVLYLNKLEFNSLKDNLYQVWLILVCWFCRKRFKKIISVFLLSLLSPLGEALSPSFEQTWIPFTKGWFVISLVKIGPVVLEKLKMEKFTDRLTDGWRTSRDQKRSLEPSTQVRAFSSGVLKRVHIPNLLSIIAIQSSTTLQCMS